MKFQISWKFQENALKRKNLKKKRFPQFQLSSFKKLRIKWQVALYKGAKEKVNASKIKKSCNLRLSIRSIQRHFKSESYRFCKAKFQIILSKKHMEGVRIITDWITSYHQWHLTVFTDEKRFTLDGMDDWRTYALAGKKVVRSKRQCKGSGVMVWMMALPNYLLSFHIIQRKFRSENHIKLLKEKVLPIIMLNFGKTSSFNKIMLPFIKTRKSSYF